MRDPHERLVANIRVQAHGCRQSNSPFYGDLFELIALDVVARGVWWAILEPFAAELFPTVRPLRVVGRLHKLALTGEESELARHFPSTGGDGDAAAMWPAVVRIVRDRPGDVADALARPVQTNEVGRSVALVGGMLVLAERLGRPLALREIGSSAGLNLRVDRYWYEQAGAGWGDPESPVRFVDPFVGATPPFDAPLRIVDRRGCDLHPLDVTTADGADTLLGFVWPEQTERLAALRQALDVARSMPVTIDQAGAVEWVDGIRPRDGVTTVLYHSVMWQYLTDEERSAIEATLTSIGSRATGSAPLAWLRLEPPPGGQNPMELKLTVWPGGEDETLAVAGFHRQPVQWLYSRPA